MNQIEYDHIHQTLKKKSNITPLSLTEITLDFDDDEIIFNRDDNLKNSENVFILLEGWMPPIRETILYLLNLRKYYYCGHWINSTLLQGE